MRNLGASYLGEKGSPDRLDLIDLSGLDEGLDLVGLYCRSAYLVLRQFIAPVAFCARGASAGFLR